MKKAVVISAYDYYDVMAKHIRNILINNGYEVTYYIQSYNHYSKSKITACRQEATIVKTISYKHNVSIRRILSCMIFSFKVYKRVCKEKPDFVYSIIPPNTLSSFLWRGKKKIGYRLVLDIIDSWPESFSVNNRVLDIFASPLFTIWKRIRDDSIVHADLILGVSKKALSVFPECPCEKRLFYPMPREKGELSLDVIDVENAISFCYVGGINRLLNMNRVADILSEVCKLKKAEFHIIGGGEKKPEFISLLKGSGITVIDHGELYEWKEKYPIYSKCAFGINVPNIDACVTMSLKGTEYLCASLPLINEAVGDTEILIEKYSAGINTRGLSASSIADIICNYSNEEIIEMKRRTNQLYKEEFESRNNKSLLF